MNNKGFTLVELLASIAIIAMISLIITPMVTVAIKNNKVEACKKIFSSVEEAAKEYVSDNRYKINDLTAGKNLNVDDLEEYLSGSLINPLDKEDNLSDSIVVTVTYNNTTKKFNYETKADDKNAEEYCQ